MDDVQTMLGGLGRGMKSRIARELEITPGAVSQWQEVPADKVLVVERITGISRHRLNPRVFGPEVTQ